MGARERERAYCTVNSTVVQYSILEYTHYREREGGERERGLKKRREEWKEKRRRINKKCGR